MTNPASETWRDFVLRYCTERGMFLDQAEAVLTRVIMAIDEPMTRRWDDYVAGYPPAMLALIAATTNLEALAWIDENLPQAFYRPLFEDAHA